MPWTIINQGGIVNAVVLRPRGLSRRILEGWTLPNEHHFADEGLWSGLEAEQIDAGSSRIALLVSAIPFHTAIAGIPLSPVGEGADALAGNVVDGQPHPAGLG